LQSIVFFLMRVRQVWIPLGSCGPLCYKKQATQFIVPLSRRIYVSAQSDGWGRWVFSFTY